MPNLLAGSRTVRSHFKAIKMSEARLVESYFKKYGFVRHQIEGFERFVGVILPDILRENAKIDLETKTNDGNGFRHEVRLLNVDTESPTHAEANGCVFNMMPHEARLRKLTYSLKVQCELQHIETHVASIVDAKQLRLGNGIRAVRCSAVDWVAKKLHFDDFEMPFVQEHGDDDNRADADNLQGPMVVYAQVKDGVASVLRFLPDSGSEHANVRVLKNTHTASFMLPCMVKTKYCHIFKNGINSKECSNDSGGYFIVNGHEKTLVAQQKLCTNRIYVFTSKKGIFAEIRSCHRTKWRSTSTLQLLFKKGVVVGHVPFVLKSSSTPLDIPFKILVAALSDDDAAEWIRKRSLSKTCPMASEVLPHLGLDEGAETVLKKKAFLELMHSRLLKVQSGNAGCDDRDDQANKRVDGAGPSLGILFRQIFRATMKSIKQLLRRLVDTKGRYVNFSSALNFSKLTTAIRYHFATGNWSLSKGINMGVVQLLTGTSATSRRSHLNRVNVPINRDGKATKPRLLHDSSFGILCPSESPEGASCGLMNNKALLCHISTGMTTDMRDNILEILKVRCKLAPFEAADKNNLVFLCGDIVGRAPSSAKVFAKSVRALKVVGTLPFDMGVAVTDKMVYLMFQPGRCVRPLRVIASDIPSWCDDWDAAVHAGHIEYLDKYEEKFLKAAGIFNCRYKEVSKYGFLSEAVASIPFSNRNQAPRNMYQASMAKQAIGWPSLAVDNLYEAQTYVLHTPQRPLVRTAFDRIADDVPNTMSCVVAIATCGGFNQEDSVIINRAAIERGLGTVSYLSSKTSQLNQGRDCERFERPKSNCSGSALGSNVDFVETDGFPTVGTIARNGDVLIGKTARIGDKDVCRSVIHDGANARVDSVVKYDDSRGNGAAMVRLRRVLPLRVGDKISSRHGQKGTIGCVYNQEDMPFNPHTGMCPDIILNPHCIPSRMTIAQLLEMVCGKMSAIAGNKNKVDATPFEKISINGICNELKNYGYEPRGKEMLCSGHSGKILNCRVFVGVCAYQRLKHIACMKIHSRGATGPVSVLTRQPLEGRSRGGGLRFGEMERDTLLSHGSSGFMLDRLLHCSDPHDVAICADCGHIADGKNCAFCEKKSEPKKKVTMPYSFLLLHRELQAMGISTQIRLRMKEPIRLTNYPVRRGNRPSNRRRRRTGRPLTECF